jgi:hypothetical protein
MTRRNLPSSFDGSLTPFMSRARLRSQADDVDAMLGGTERLYHEANRTPETYRWFKDYQAKLQPKEATVEHGISSGVEALLKRVEERKKERAAQVIDGSFRDLTHATQEQPDEGS